VKIKMENITNQEIEKALADDSGDLGNDVLYRLCREHPLHKTDQEIIAKVWLIGRSYAAAIERRKNKSSDLPGEKFYASEVAPKIKQSEIDQWLAVVNIENAIETHWKVMGLFEKISGHKNRSLSSKYLHFHHKDLFFIYDSRSAAAIRKVAPGNKELPNLSSENVDQEYVRFFQRCLWLKENLEQQYGKPLSPRDVDKILLEVEDRI